MGNASSAGVRIENHTEIPLVFVLSQVAPMYWGILQPGERVSLHTGRVWFTVETYAYTGDNVPTIWDAVKDPLLIGIATIATVVTGGVAAIATAPALGIAEATAIGIATGACTSMTAGGSALTASKALATKPEQRPHRVVRKGHYANGGTIRVRGGPVTNERRTNWEHWEPMRFELQH